jgi:uroporphyrinogen-III synthase
MAVVVTRPQPEAARWAGRLRERGLATIVLPLLAILPPRDDQPLRRAAASLRDYRAVMFVSANAVQGFLAMAPDFNGPRAWAPGPATRDALRAAGVAGSRIDAPADDAAQFDSESLWQQVGTQLHAGDRLLLVRGADAEGRSQGREWLAQQLAARGVAVDTVAAYRRALPDWSEEERAQAARCAADGSLWLFSSSEAAANLGQLLPQQDFGFGSVAASRPAVEEVLASIESHR